MPDYCVTKKIIECPCVIQKSYTSVASSLTMTGTLDAVTFYYLINHRLLADYNNKSCLGAKKNISKHNKKKFNARVNLSS